MTEVEVESVKERIIALQVEHRDLDDVISRISHMPDINELELRRLKKRKLYLKDHIFMLERQLTPDISA
jgi:hypothetical protein